MKLWIQRAVGHKHTVTFSCNTKFIKYFMRIWMLYWVFNKFDLQYLCFLWVTGSFSCFIFAVYHRRTWNLFNHYNLFYTCSRSAVCTVNNDLWFSLIIHLPVLKGNIYIYNSDLTLIYFNTYYKTGTSLTHSFFYLVWRYI